MFTYRMKHAQREVRRHPVLVLGAEIRVMARPGISIRRVDHICTDGIQVNVSDELQQIAVGIHENGVITFLEQVPSRMQAALNAARVSSSDPEHQPPQRNVAYLNQKMHVIGHQTVCVQSGGEAFDDFGSELVEEISVFGLEEYVLAVIASQRDVVERAGHVQT